jgi:hypothetical protein
MKETPQEKRIHNNMKAGVMSANGFLGDDRRHYHEIIETDMAVLSKLGVTQQEVAQRMMALTDAAFESYMGSVEVEDHLIVEYTSFRGKLTCPFAHPGGFRKGSITLHNTRNGITLRWTPLNIHMIEAHGFFEGLGSQHRLDPTILVQALFE